jgi:hypothetical protein
METAASFMARALGWYSDLGVSVERILTDIQTGCALQMLGSTGRRDKDRWDRRPSTAVA